MLTPAGLQKTAWGMLNEIVKPARNEKLSRRLSAGLNTEPYLIAGTRPYRFGDLLQIDTSASLMNTLKRTGGRPPLRLTEEDLEVYEKEPVLRTATAVLFDLSKSMKYQDRYRGGKKSGHGPHRPHPQPLCAGPHRRGGVFNLGAPHPRA